MPSEVARVGNILDMESKYLYKRNEELPSESQWMDDRALPCLKQTRR